MENEVQSNIPPVQPLPQTPSIVPPSTNWSKILLFTVLGLMVITTSVFVGIQIGKGQTVNQQTLTIQPSTTPSQTVVNPSMTPKGSITPDKSQTTILTIQKLNFSIPKSWWFKKGKNETFPIEWYDLNPTKLNEPYSMVPLFQVRTDKENKSLSDKKSEAVKTWHLINVESTEIFSGSLQGLKIQGIVDPSQDNYNSRFIKGARVQFGLFVFEENSYQILGDVSDIQNQNIFNQILSTFNFTN